MNIGVVHPFFEVIAGAEKSTFSLLNALENTSHHLKLYTIIPPKYTTKPNYDIHTTNYKRLPYFSNYQRMRMIKKLFQNIKNEDVVVISSGGFTLEPTTVNRIIHYCHSSFEEVEIYLNSRSSNLKGFYNSIIQKNIKKSIKILENENVELISNSKYTEKSIMNRFHKKSSAVIYPPVSIDEFTPTQKQPQFVSIGRFSEEKNLEFGIDVASKLDFSYNIIGNTKTKSNIVYYEKLLSKIKKLSSEYKIQIFKNIERNDLITQLNISKVYFHTAKESFGISVIEAIAAGCIPIVPDNSAHKETVPFEELRYRENDMEDAKNKIESAINGKFDSFLPQLKQHINKFSVEKFQLSMIRHIENIS